MNFNDLHIKNKRKQKKKLDSSLESLETNNNVKKLKKRKKHEETELEDINVSSEKEHVFVSPNKKKKKHQRASEKMKDVTEDLNTSKEDMGYEGNTTMHHLNSLFPKQEEEASLSEEDHNVIDKEIQEQMKMLQLALDQVAPSKYAYNKHLKMINYKKIAKKIPAKSPEECEKEIKFLIDRTVKVKSLHQLLQETIQELPQKGKKLFGFASFFVENKAIINEEFKKGGESENRMTIASRLWNSLTDEEMEKYRHYGRPVKTKTVGKTPFELYCAVKKDKDSSIIEMREKWAKLKLSKRVKYIIKSIEIMKAEKEQQEKEGGEEEDKKKIKGPNKRELEDYLYIYCNMPRRTPHTVAYYYFLETNNKDSKAIDPRSRLIFANNAFKLLPKNEQEFWIEKFEMAKESYKEEIKAWREKQSPLTIYSSSLISISKTKSSKKEKQVIPKVELHSIEMPIGNVNFKNEPAIPPLKPFLVYMKDIERRKNIKLTQLEARKQFKKQEPEVQEAYNDKCNKIRRTFIDGLKAFVANMNAEERRLFLGLRRVKYKSKLGEDIFEEDYPNAEYPVYISPVKNKGKKVESSKSKSKQKSSQAASSKKNQEPVSSDEEEDGVESHHHPPSRSKAVRKDFTSDSESDSPASELEAKKTMEPRPKKMDEDSDSNEEDENEGLVNWMSNNTKSLHADTDSDESDGF